MNVESERVTRWKSSTGRLLVEHVEGQEHATVCVFKLTGTEIEELVAALRAVQEQAGMVTRFESVDEGLRRAFPFVKGADDAS